MPDDLLLLCFGLQDRVSVCSLGCPRAHPGEQIGLQPTGIRLPEIKHMGTTPQHLFFLTLNFLYVYTVSLDLAYNSFTM